MSRRDGPGEREPKMMSLRLAPDLAEQLQAVAEVEGRPVVEVVREAIAEHVDRRRNDPGFQQRLRVRLERHRRLLELLRPD